MWATASWPRPPLIARRAPRLAESTRRVFVVASSSRASSSSPWRRTKKHASRLPARWGSPAAGSPAPPREGTACAGERADGDTEEAASALDGAERALEAMRLLGAEPEDEAGDAEAAIGSGSFEEDASSAAASRDETMPTSRSGGGGDAPAVRERASVVASASGAGLPSPLSAPEAEPPRGADIPGTGPSSRALPGKRARVRNFLRRARGLRALTDTEVTTLRLAKEAKKAETRAKKAETRARKAALKAEKRRERRALQQKARDNDVSTRENQKKRRKDPYDALRGGFDKKKLRAFFNRRPGSVATRLAAVIRVGARVVRLWRREEKLEPSRRTRGDALRDALGGLGPVFVKIGQTLSQRPDLIGDEAANALKSLQMSNAPFPDDIAWRAIAEDLAHAGPLAPKHASTETCARPNDAPLFAAFGDAPVAAASLGQVYQATLWSGERVAVKVQRPNVVRQVALDWTVWSLCLSTLQKAWSSKANLGDIADEVGEGVFKELDYVNEARNMDEFNRRHDWLGFVRAPKWYPEFTGPEGVARVLTTEWIEGKHISDLPPERRLTMAQMAVEACVAQLTYTGFVHADPHEGNILLDERDGSLVFLDFGLVAEVEDHVMEGFARGIQCMIAGDWLGLTYVFRDVGMCPPEAFYRKVVPELEAPSASKKKKKKKKRKTVDVECSAEEMAGAIEACLTAEEGGQSRFGALATGLGAMSSRYKFLTPPYIVLLVRTFLTLEGIAAKADPDFNIYTASLPYAIRRAMAPATPEGRRAMRDAFLNEHDNSVRWDRIAELLGNESSESSESSGSSESSESSADARRNRDAPEATKTLQTTKRPLPTTSSELPIGDDTERDDTERAASGSVDETELDALRPMARAGEDLLSEVMDSAAAAAATAARAVPSEAETSRLSKDAGKELIARRSQEVVGRLMGAKEGAALRRVANDACSVSLASYLSSPAAQPLREAGVATMADVLRDVWSVRQQARSLKGEVSRVSRGLSLEGSLSATSDEASSSSSSSSSAAWPESDEARVIREREDKTKRKALTVIALGHARRLLTGHGARGVFLLCGLVATAIRMSLLAVAFAVADAAEDAIGAASFFVWRRLVAPARAVIAAERERPPEEQGKR